MKSVKRSVIDCSVLRLYFAIEAYPRRYAREEASHSSPLQMKSLSSSRSWATRSSTYDMFNAALPFQKRAVSVAPPEYFGAYHIRSPTS